MQRVLYLEVPLYIIEPIYHNIDYAHWKTLYICPEMMGKQVRSVCLGELLLTYGCHIITFTTHSGISQLANISGCIVGCWSVWDVSWLSGCIVGCWSLWEVSWLSGCIVGCWSLWEVSWLSGWWSISSDRGCSRFCCDIEYEDSWNWASKKSPLPSISETICQTWPSSFTKPLSVTSSKSSPYINIWRSISMVNNITANYMYHEAIIKYTITIVSLCTLRLNKVLKWLFLKKMHISPSLTILLSSQRPWCVNWLDVVARNCCPNNATMSCMCVCVCNKNELWLV